MPKNIACPACPGVPWSVPRVSDPITDHRAAVREKLVDQEADLSRRAVEDLRKRNIRRDQILDRLWELATLSSEATRGSIAGQMKALSMIVAIEGLIPSKTMNDRRLTPSVTQPVATPHKQPAAPAAPTEPVVPRVPEPPFAPPFAPPLAHDAGTLNPFVIPQPLNRVPAPTTSFFDVALDAINSVKLPYSANLPRSL